MFLAIWPKPPLSLWSGTKRHLNCFGCTASKTTRWKAVFSLDITYEVQFYTLCIIIHHQNSYMVFKITFDTWQVLSKLFHISQTFLDLPYFTLVLILQVAKNIQYLYIVLILTTHVFREFTRICFFSQFTVK